MTPTADIKVDADIKMEVDSPQVGGGGGGNSGNHGGNNSNRGPKRKRGKCKKE